MRTFILIFLALFGLTNSVNCQELNLVSTSGTYSETPSGSVSWSIGEVVIATGTGTTNEVTQGFHQSNIWILGTEELVELEINIFPNPTCEFVNISAPQDAILSIYDMEGRLVSIHNLIEATNTIDVSSFSRGTYNLVFSTKDNQQKSAKLIVQ